MRPWLRSLSAAALAMLVALFVCGCGQGSNALTDRPQIASGVVMRDVILQSASLGREMPYRVFMPEKMAEGQRLPVVYLLHGNGGSYREWSNGSDVSRYAARGYSKLGIILVMPEGGSSYYLNSVGRPEERFEDYLTRDLIADVERRFPARRDRAGRAIVGVSMGGFAAMKLALSRPELYGFAGGISPAIDVAQRRFSWRRWGQWVRFRELLGPWGSEARKARDPFALALTARPENTPYLYLTAGQQEPLQEPIQRFAQRLNARGFLSQLRAKPGGHDWGEWDAQIPGCFEALELILR